VDFIYVKNWVIKSASHFFQRSCELGIKGTLQRAWLQTKNQLKQWGLSVWWGWRAHIKMSDNDLLRFTTGDWKSVDALLNHLANRHASSFLLQHESPQETIQLLNHDYPEYISTVLAKADAACQNELTLFGQVYKFSNDIDWHRDPATGKRFPVIYIKYIERYIESSTRPMDIILLWELNRHQHFITLGMAYWLTGNQKYVDAFCSQVQGWIDTNPLQHGVNWCYGLEISIRLIAWTVAFQFFRHSKEFREKVGNAFLKSLWQQADFLKNHLQNIRSKNDIPNNHMMAELTGLVIIGAAFPEFRKSTEWREIGLNLLNIQAIAQTHPDGVNKEQATGYHRFVAELILLVVARSRQNILPYVPILEDTLEHMLNYVLFSLTPVGTAPMWGDSDFGRALGLGLDKDFWDFRPILSAGAVLFKRADWKFAAGRFDEEAFWLLGSDGLGIWKQLDSRLPDQISRTFPQGGMYILRDGWSGDTDVAFFRCGPFGQALCAHAHCDLLSVVLWVKGKPLLVDSGTFTYYGSWRDHFRLTAAHNTVTIDGQDQALPRPQFNWEQIPEAKCIEWSKNRVTGSLTYSNQVEFIRELSHPQPDVWELCDIFRGHGKTHEVSWYFHFASDLTLHWNNISKNLVIEKDGKSFAEASIPIDVNIEIKSDWFSYNYGKKESNPMLHCIWRGEIPNDGIKFYWKFVGIE